MRLRQRQPKCYCGHLWWWHEYPSGKLKKDIYGNFIPRRNNIFYPHCGLCMNFPQLPLDGHTVKPITEHIEKDYCIGFKWKKK